MEMNWKIVTGMLLGAMLGVILTERAPWLAAFVYLNIVPLAVLFAASGLMGLAPNRREIGMKALELQGGTQ
jgi:hypothetical protein